jgi:pimeloyl-ACP methyl ester carboxylesterase
VAYVRLVLSLAIRGPKWAAIDRLLEANLTEHRLQGALDATSAERFSTVTARTVLLGGADSPDTVSGPLLHELAAAIPCAEVAVLSGLGHLAPQDHPDRMAAEILARRLPR